ncbi:hypothetical protein PA3071 [hydrothermal vent metagenome]|uniref:DUF58 domain-containing protein n=1 Tax=hydrothermal vent metagenome TaxID=652676 RepID=A0A3B0YMQ3_9ZZZZ
MLVAEPLSPVKISLHELINLRHSGESIRLRVKQSSANQSGAYRASFKGRGMEFDEVRPYADGDDIRMLDWKVTARTNKPHTKLFREERERPIQLCVDLRPGMFFATRKAYKSVWASRAASLLAWSSLKHRDRLGGLVFSNEGHHELRPATGSRGVLSFLRMLAEQSVWNEKNRSASNSDALYQALLRLRRVTRPGSLIFIFSDFSGLDKGSKAQLYHLGKHNDLVLVACFDPLDKNLPPNGHYRIDDGQRDLSFSAANPYFRKEYEQRFTAHIEQLHSLTHLRGIRLIESCTTEDPLQSLQANLGVCRR